MLASSLSTALVTAGPASAATSPTPQLDVTSRPDAVSASAAALTEGHRVEDVSQRTEYSQTFANSDGTWTSEASTEPAFVQATDGTWQDIDTTLVLRDGRLEPRAAIADLSVSDGGDTTFAELHQDGKELDWHSAAPLPSPTIDGSTATYADAVPGGGDLVVTATATGFTHDIVLSSPPTAATGDPTGTVSYTVPIATHGATLDTTAAGGVDVSASNDTVVTAPAPLMYDAAGDPGAGASVAPIDVNVGHNAAGTPTMTLTADSSYLTDPKTIYPVTIDPTFTVDATSDTFASSNNPTLNYSSATSLQTGENALNDIDRAFLHFNFPAPNSLTGKNIVSASLQLQNNNAHSCTGSQINATRITDSWNAGSLNWNNQPNVNTTGSAGFSPAYGYSANCPSNKATWDVTQIAQYWADNQGSNYGIRLKAGNEGDWNSWRSYRSLDNTVGNSVNPKMTVTTDTYPNAPTALSVSPGNTGYTTTTTPTLSAAVSDPDLGNVKGYFEVKNSGGTVVWSGTSSSWVGNHGRATIAVPTGKLSDGSSYTVRAWSVDPSNAKSHSATPALSFKVDTTKPAVAVSSDRFTDQSWTSATPATSTLTYAGSSDTSYFLVSRDGSNQTMIWAGSQGTANQPWTPTSGWHVFAVTPVDKAGNQGDSVTLSFGTGTGAAAVGTPNAESTESFPLTLSGPPGASSATLQWRLHGEATWRDTTQVEAAGAAWSASDVTSSSANTVSPPLIWKAIGEPMEGDSSLSAPAVVEVRGCFHYAGPDDVCTPASTMQLVPFAFGGNFPTADLGPLSVALFTGEAALNETDVTDLDAGLARTFSSFDNSTLTSGLFGPGWSDPGVLSPADDSAAAVIDNRSKDGSFVISNPGGGSQTFIPSSLPLTDTTTTWTPLDPTGDATVLKLARDPDGVPLTLELDRPVGDQSSKVVWTYTASDTGKNPGWIFSSTDQPGTIDDITVESDHQRPTWMEESNPGASGTCTASRQTVGCRGLYLTYTGTGSATRLSSAQRIIGAASQTAVVPKTVATYTYDDSGKLSRACSPAPDGDSGSAPPLCAQYTYVDIGSRTLLATYAAPGQTAWRFSYDTTGRLAAVKRSRPDNSGDSTWSIDYSLAPTAAGLPDLSAATAAQWGQTTPPTKSIAVYRPFAGAPSVTKSVVYYTDDAGTTTNTASYSPSAAGSGWQVDSLWYDDKGDPVRHLSGPGWARVQSAPPAERPKAASDASEYTIYNTWGDASTVETKVTDEYGPSHTATLKDGTVGIFRRHTATLYDDTPGVDPSLTATRPGNTALGLIVESIESAADVGRANDYDPITTKYGYDPIATGDPSGWTLGIATTESRQVDANSWATTTTRFDNQGRVIETRRPGGATHADGTGADARSSERTYYTSSSTGSGTCDGHPEWAGLPCTVAPPDTQSSLSIRYAAYTDALQPSRVEESVAGVVRGITTTDYDDVERVTKVTTETTGPEVDHEISSVTYGYDPQSGLPRIKQSAGHTDATSYDAWGRPDGYSDTNGNNALTTFDAAGNVQTVNDGAGNYTYTYDDHGTLTNVNGGVGVGTFNFTYDLAGNLATLTYPNGLTATRSYDEIGEPTSLEYRQGSTTIADFEATYDPAGRQLAASSPESAQAFAYDRLGRLVQVQDTRTGGCTTRAYTFDPSSNRAMTTYAPSGSGDCQTTSGIASPASYGSDGRITNPGYVYDALGRTTTFPRADVGSAGGTSDLTATYHSDDMIASLQQNVTTSDGGQTSMTTKYGLDPDERINSITTFSGGTETGRLRYEYGDATDSPAAVDTSVDAGTTWTTTRYIKLPAVGLSASVTDGSALLYVTNIEGDIVATQQSSAGAQLSGYSEADEYGNTLDGTTAGRYAWLGSRQRSTDALGGIVLMGARIYNPVTGLFASPDPVDGGNETPYNYPDDPVNGMDPTGEGICVLGFGDCDFDVKNMYNHTVHVSETVIDHIWDGHRVSRGAIRWAIENGEADDDIPTTSKTRKAYLTRKAHSVYCRRLRGCQVENHWVRFVVIVEWRDGIKDHGQLATVYCYKIKGWCPKWVGDRNTVWVDV